MVSLEGSLALFSRAIFVGFRPSAARVQSLHNLPIIQI